jgi:hypothetical protein
MHIRPYRPMKKTKKPHIDASSVLDVESRLSVLQARKLLAEFFHQVPNKVFFTRHAVEKMKLRNMDTQDIKNVLRGGSIYDGPEFENGSYRYRVQTNRMTVVIAFRSPDTIVVVTAWRNQ